MKKNLLIVSAAFLISSSITCMNKPNKKARVASKQDDFPAWKWEVDGAIQKGDTEKFAALVKKHDIKDHTLISSLPGLSLIALGPKETRIPMATILLDNSANVDQTSPDPIAGSTTALSWACIEGDEAFAYFLISRGAKILRSDDVKRHPLTLALKYHPENTALIKTVMRGSHLQSSLTPVIANAKKYFIEYPRENRGNTKYSMTQIEIQKLDEYRMEIENSHSTSSTKERE